MSTNFPIQKQGLYNPLNEKDSCGVGMIAKINGERNHFIVDCGLKILMNMEHRGAAGSDPKAGDGAGLLTQLPYEFFNSTVKELKGSPADESDYAVGMFFFPQDQNLIEQYKQIIESEIQKEQLLTITWRGVPVNPDCLSKKMLPMVPAVQQVFVSSNSLDSDELERRLYIVRRQIENKIEESDLPDKNFFYCCSFSSRNIIYKGMFLAFQLREFFPDLSHPKFISSIAVVHQRYSTNTFPSWSLAQPFRSVAHNGEINTIQGNINWINAREDQFMSHLFGDNLKKTFPVIRPDGSDTSSFDNVFEFLCQTGRSLERTMSMMIPQAWENDAQLDEKIKGYYEYNSALMEPWDGPVAMIFSDGINVGAALDRNGLRPLRFEETAGGYFVLGSEAGIAEIPNDKIIKKGKLKPGQMLLVDTIEECVRYDSELKMSLASENNYCDWVRENKITLGNLNVPPALEQPQYSELALRQRVFNYTYEEIHQLIKPMAIKGEEAIGAMGTDTPLAILSNKSKLIYNYFKQRFAQVTNPPIDSIREEIVMSLRSMIGGRINPLEDASSNCNMLVLDHPILTNANLEQLRHANVRTFRAAPIDICYEFDKKNLEEALDLICEDAEKKVRDGFLILILSDRGYSESKIPIPSLLAVSAVHHHLIKIKKRNKIGLVLESGEAREVHHFALLIGYGATAINPYLAFECIDKLRITNHINPRVSSVETPNDEHQPQKNYIKAINKGLKKIFAKMGISTLSSYQGAQIFEAIGLDHKVIEKYFTGTRSAVEGANIGVLEEELKIKHVRAYAQEASSFLKLLTGGEYNWCSQGEEHIYNPRVIHLLQQAAWKNDRNLYNEFAKEVDSNSTQIFRLRGLMKFKPSKNGAIPLDQVEPVQNILKRFTTGAISIGAISREAHETLAIAMNRLGGKSNTGEGGEDALRYIPDENGDLRISRIKQVASGRFGVTSHYLVNADELQIKISQGAKPGEGGQLPGHKVDDYIAMLRHTIPGVGLISPPPHHDIYSIEDLSQLIFDLKNANTGADISVKLVSSFGVGTVAAGVAKAKADCITIAGFDGGSGASPQSSIKHAGIPWEIGLAETQQTLILNDMRGQVLLEVDGQLKTGRDVVIGAMLGADRFGFATSALIAVGCIMMRKCHLNTCPVGIATQDKYLRSKYHGKPEYVQNYLTMVAEEVREIMAMLGVKKFTDLTGNVGLLDTDETLKHWKSKNLDISPLLHMPKIDDHVSIRNTRKQAHSIDDVLDRTLIEQCSESLEKGTSVYLNSAIKNLNRSVGCMLGSEISKKFGAKGLPEDTIRINFTGTAGQSFGAYVPNGLTLKLHGQANDYVGKGLSGGKLIIMPENNSQIVPDKNIIIGNTVLYGATSGKAFFNGIAGERFAVRNSGAIAVVEGAGDHCCEYMTGGTVVILGETGKNFGAGMSGGLAYIYDPKHQFNNNCNMAMVNIERVSDPERVEELHSLIVEHVEYTASPKGKRILANWKKFLDRFVLVIPLEYRKILVNSNLQKKLA